MMFFYRNIVQTFSAVYEPRVKAQNEFLMIKGAQKLVVTLTEKTKENRQQRLKTYQGNLPLKILI